MGCVNTGFFNSLDGEEVRAKNMFLKTRSVALIPEDQRDPNIAAHAAQTAAEHTNVAGDRKAVYEMRKQSV